MLMLPLMIRRAMEEREAYAADAESLTSAMPRLLSGLLRRL